MDHYLQFCRSNLTNFKNFKQIFLVVGNESCDLDSAVSAIVLAYIKYHELSNATSSSQNDSEVLVLPLLNVLRQDLHLRREIVFWFEKVLQFELEWLICRDEIDFDAINSSPAQITISLVDHNENKEFARLLPKAQFDEIIDHHQPQSLDSPQFKCPLSNVQIDTSVGSCCSLIALRYFKSNITQHKFGSGTAETYDSQIALVLYGPILLDTSCLNNSIKRFNAKDYEAINKLEDLMKHPADVESSIYDRNEVFQRLLAAKNSLDGLSFDDLLRKDMKIVESLSDNNLIICISSICGTLLTELNLRDKLKELRNFCNNPPKTAVISESRTRLFTAVLLTNLDNRIQNNLRRQLAIYCTNKHLMRTIATCLERSELELELITALESLRIYNQNNLQASRKVVLPIISTILNGPGREETFKEAFNKINKPFISSSLKTPPKSSNSYIISTAEVDPEFLLNYKSETIKVPEFEELIQKSHLEDSSTSQADYSVESENGKRGENNILMNGNGDLVQSSAPSSFIQQPDSYYGSFIDDSFVGEFVGDYNDPDSAEHENILVMDADGQNLVMMNPTETSVISHGHEIEFDFDSFGPESIIYSGSVEAGHKNEEINSKKIEPSIDNVQNGHSTDKILNDQPKDEQFNNVEDKTKEEVSTENLNSEKENPTIIVENGENSKDEPKLLQQELDAESPLKNGNNQDTFSRNSTLSKSQRKKVLPRVNIKNLVLSNDAYSPPALDQLMTPPLKSVVPIADSLVADTEMDKVENSSQIYNNSLVVNDPLGVSTPMNDNHSTSNLGLNRQQSMKKKVEVNYSMFLDTSDEKSTTINDSNGDSQIETTSDERNANDDISAHRRPSLPFSNNEIRSIDLKVIEPYKNVISHGGRLRPTANGNGLECSSPAIILFAACYLPDRSRADYNYVMDNLFLYVVSTLHNMVADDYILIYLHNGGNVPASSCSTVNNMPKFNWLKRCYQMIDRKLKKNLKGLYLVHPTFWLKTIIIMSKPFISSKFSKKLKFVQSLEELKQMIPIDDIAIPEAVKIYDQDVQSSFDDQQLAMTLT